MTHDTPPPWHDVADVIEHNPAPRVPEPVDEGPADQLAPPDDAPTDDAQKAEGGALAHLSRTMTEFDKVSAGIADLEKRFGGVVFDLTTSAGMREAEKARADVRAPRYAVQRARDAAKRELNDVKRDIEQRAEQIIKAIDAIETPIVQQIEAEVARRAAERAKAEQLQRERAESLASLARAGFDALSFVHSLTLSELSARLREVGQLDTSAEAFGDLAADATAAQSKALADIEQAMNIRAGIDAEKKRADEERERLAAEREQAKADARELREQLDKLAAQLAELQRAQAPAAPAPAAVAAPADDADEEALPAGLFDVAPLQPAAEPSTAAPAVEEEAAPALKLSDIVARLGLPMTAATLQQFDIHPAGRAGAAVLFREGDFATLCRRLVLHVMRVAEAHGVNIGNDQ